MTRTTKWTLAFTLMAIPAASYAGDIKLPHYGTVKSQELCGQSSGHCQASYGRRYVKMTDLTYEGKPDEFLGRRYSSIYNTEPCNPVFPAGKWEKHHELKRDFSLDDAEEQNAKVKAEADVAGILGTVGVNLPDDIKAKLLASFKEQLTRNKVKKIAATWYTLRPTQDVRDSMMIACRDNTPRNQNVVHSLAIVEVEGSWYKKFVEDTFTDYEASAGIPEIGGDGGASYRQVKKEVIEGTVPKSAYIVAVSYERGKQRNN